MGPKKAKAKETIVGGYSIEEMTEDELRDYAQKLQESLLGTEKETEHFQVEKSGLELAWEDSRRQLATKTKLLQTKAAELSDFRMICTKLLDEMDRKLDFVEREDLQGIFQALLQHNLDQFHCEKQNLRLEREASQRVLQREEERQHIEAAYEKLLQSIRQTRCEDTSELIQHHEWILSRTFMKYEHVYEELWNVINRWRLTQLQEAEQSRNEQIKKVDLERTKEFRRIRTYFTRMSFDCLALIGDLKYELEEAKRTTTEKKNLLNQAVSKNKRLHDHKDECGKIGTILSCYKNDKAKFVTSRQIMLHLMQLIKDFELRNHMLEAEIEDIAEQRGCLEDHFFVSVKQLQESSTLRNVYLEKQLKALTTLLNKKKQGLPTETQVAEVTETRPKIKQTLKSAHNEPSAHPVNVVNLVFRDSMVRFKPPPPPKN